ncbi:MAG: excinuclease ABC subunit UvrC [Polyangiales bacterium]
MVTEPVRAKLDTLPTQAGVYVFRDGRGGVLYVGKASNLRSRVRSYFQPGSTDARAFVSHLEREMQDIETWVVDSEKEAALLENQLIKQHRPRYNVKLRDDKEYLSLRLDPKAEWPRLEVVRRPKPDGALYFGPYHSATSARETLRLVNRHFQLRTCTDADFKSRTRPCLQHQIRRCPAPCVKPVDREEYGEQVRNVSLFLEGRHDELVEHLQSRMTEASDAMEYERAAVHRDQLRAVDRVREQQRVAAVRDVDQDVVGYFRQADQVEMAVLLVREGKLVGVRTFELSDVSLPDAELVASFVAEFYEGGSFVPDQVLLPVAIEAMDGLAQMLGERRGKKVEVRVPQRGAGVRLLKMAMDNAAHSFAEKRRAEQDAEKRLAEVQKRLGLPSLPHHIECVDVSHIGGEDTVASVVALADGAPDKKRYRSFHVKRARAGDDYGAMYEVLSRRFRRGRDREEGWELPDLIVVDGGKGQLNVALAALRDLGLESVPAVALAKEKENVAGETLVDRVYTPGRKNPVALKSSPALSMLALGRDEAHRASNNLRRKRGKRSAFQTGLDAVPGVGPKTRRKLLTALGSTRAVTQASEEELLEAGATRRQACAIREAFHGPEPQRAADAMPPPEAAEAEDRAVDNAFRG